MSWNEIINFMLNLILGGMWGFYNERNRSLAKEIFRKMIDTKIAGKYHKKAPIQKDQLFLSDYVSPLIKSQSIIHDSYFCVQ